MSSLLFVATSFFSFRNVFHFRRTGTMPDTVADPTFDAQTNAAFSSNPAHDFEEEDEFRSGRTADRPGAYVADHEQDYALLQQSELDDMQNHGVQGSYDPTAPAPGQVMHDYDTSYGGAYGQHYNEPSHAAPEPYEPYGQSQSHNYGYQQPS
jgi:translocation protein SEC72